MFFSTYHCWSMNHREGRVDEHSTQLEFEAGDDEEYEVE